MQATKPIFHCYECEGDLCTMPINRMPLCITAINCFKSTIRESADIVQKLRGCVTSLRHNQNICNNITQGKHSDYGYKCCNKNECNGGDFPELNDPYVESYYGWKYILLYITLVIIFIAFIAVLVSLYKLHKFDSRMNRRAEEHRRQEMVEMLDVDSRRLNEAINGQAWH